MGSEEFDEQGESLALGTPTSGRRGTFIAAAGVAAVIAVVVGVQLTRGQGSAKVTVVPPATTETSIATTSTAPLVTSPPETAAPTSQPPATTYDPPTTEMPSEPRTSAKPYSPTYPPASTGTVTHLDPPANTCHDVPPDDTPTWTCKDGVWVKA